MMPTPRSAPTPIRFPVNLLARLRAQAALQQTTLSAVVRAAIGRGLAAMEAAPSVRPADPVGQSAPRRRVISPGIGR